MKTFKKISLWAVLAVSCLMIPATGNAQIIPNGYVNVDWQFNSLSGDYANVASGWGMNFEGGYYVTPKLGLGLFLAYSTNNKYIGRETLVLKSNSSLTADQQHSIFQLPFGAVAKYRFMTQGMFEPYVSVKLGAAYSRMSSYLQVWELYDDSWGFTVSPEIGVSFFPVPSSRYGFHLAFYYNYATNKSSVLTYDQDGRNNIGFRLGVSF